MPLGALRAGAAAAWRGSSSLRMAAAGAGVGAAYGAFSSDTSIIGGAMGGAALFGGGRAAFGVGRAGLTGFRRGMSQGSGLRASAVRAARGAWGHARGSSLSLGRSVSRAYNGFTGAAGAAASRRARSTAGTLSASVLASGRTSIGPTTLMSNSYSGWGRGSGRSGAGLAPNLWSRAVGGARDLARAGGGRGWRSRG